MFRVDLWPFVGFMVIRIMMVGTSGGPLLCGGLHRTS